MRRWLLRVAVVALLATAAIVVRQAYFAPQPVQVTVVAVERGRVEATVTNTKGGTVTARRRAHLSPEIGGRVVALPHREGSRVRSGDVLLQIDDSSQQARLALAERELDAATVQRRQACLAADLAARELERNETLAARRIISEDLLDRLRNSAATTEAACNAAEATIETARAALDVARTELAKATLTAPFAGTVAEVSVELGEWITPSPPGVPIPPVIDLIDPTSIYISAPMDEVDSATIRTGQQARITIDSFPDQVFPGHVTRVAPYVLDIETQNRTVEIEVDFEDTDFASKLLPGTSADVEVILEVLDGVLRVPTSTLLEGSAVMVIEDGVLAERPVETGLRNWDYTEITTGLAEGELVVSSLDRPEIQPGAEVVAASEGAS